jgi:hypothetical protein
MAVASFLIYVSIVFYCFPPIRQFGGRYFYYFLILAIEDPVCKLLVPLIHYPQVKVHFAFSFFLLLSIIKPNEFLKYLAVIFVPVFLFTEGISHFLSITFGNFAGIRMGIGLLHIVIFAAICKLAALYIKEKMGVNLFHIMLLLYEATVIIKFIVYVLSSSGGILFFFATLAFEIFMCVFFVIYRDDNPKLIIYTHFKNSGL